MSDLTELVTTTRFREIHDARQRVVEARTQLMEAQIIGRIDEARAAMILRQAVESYLLELEDLANPPNADRPTETDYWNDVYLGAIELPDGAVVEVYGFDDLLELPDQFEVGVEVEKHVPRKGSVVETETQVAHVPKRILRNAFRQANYFCAEIGLELDPKQNEERVFRFRKIEDGQHDDWDPQEGPKT